VKISTRLSLLSVATILVMTAAVLGAALLFLRADLRQSRERLMQLELQSVTQSIRQQLNRSGVVAASKEAAEQLRQLRGKEGFASATLFIVERNDDRIVYHPSAAMGDRVTFAFVREMLQRRAGSLEYDFRGDERMAVFQTLENGKPPRPCPTKDHHLFFLPNNDRTKVPCTSISMMLSCDRNPRA